MNTNKIDLKQLKTRLLEYLRIKSIIETNNKYRCINPGNHNNMDSHPSAVYYDNKKIFYCPVCQESWDIFAVSGVLNNLTEFKDQLHEVMNTFGIEYKKHKSTKTDLVPLQIEEARRIFRPKELIQRAINNKWGNIISGTWPYLIDGMFHLIDVRFEFTGDNNKKSVLPFYWNGKSIISKKAPILIYNWDSVLKEDEQNILIVEGCKAAEAANINLKSFVTITWRGGSGSAGKADWSFLKNKNIYIFPDDDKPGIKAAKAIYDNIDKVLNNTIKIIAPIEKARQLKEQSADIVEALQIMSPQELEEYIFNGKELELSTPPGGPNETEKNDKTDSFPFRILGTADDGRTYFIDRNERLQQYKLSSITKGQLNTLAPLSWWSCEFSAGKNKVLWDEAIDFIIELSGSIDFNPDTIRGRGAWMEPDGRLCYHDGQEVHGDYDETKLYLKKTKIDIGINDKPADYDIRKKIATLAKQMTFETPVDVVRCLSWSVLAPFCGALSWRPSFLLTGPSGSGKSTITNQLIRKLSLPHWLDGAETSSACLRGMIQNDCCAVVFEETEADTEKKKRNREELFSVMRVSSSDDAPDIGKGTKDGGYRLYKTRNMYGFIAINPEIESVADENRIFRINTKLPSADDEKLWREKIENLCDAYITNKNCRAIRAFVWKNFKKILKLKKNIAPIIKEISNQSYRYANAEALLLAAYFIVWEDTNKIDAKIIKDRYLKYYNIKPPENRRDESIEMLDRILDETIIINGYKNQITIREAAIIIYTGYRESKKDSAYDDREEVAPSELLKHRQAVGHYGISIEKTGDVAIAHNHHELMKILKRGRGFHQTLWRHPGFIEKKSVNIAGKTRYCTIIAGSAGVYE